MKNKLTHSKLVQMFAKWIKRHDQNMIIPNCPIVAEELVTSARSGEQPDVIAFCSFTSILGEIKTSRGDFLKDKTKRFRIYPELGVGEHRYYVCPVDVIKVEDLPPDWGLIYCTGKKFKIVKQSNPQCFDCLSEKAMLMSIIRRTNLKLKKALRNTKD